jgi:hypothetical protein
MLLGSSSSGNWPAIAQRNLFTLAQRRGILQAMPETATATPSPTTPSFAGLLAALTAPASSAADHSPAWNDDDLASDVATLSYEHALRAHVRYKPPDPDGWDFPQAPNPIADGVAPAGEADVNARTAIASAAPAWGADRQAPSGQSLPTAMKPSRKATSVTIRMSQTECAQLHQRAAEAGLTVSAYLRSCTFEAEALRAEVKEALARLRASTSAEKPSVPAPAGRDVPARRSGLGWLARLLPPWRSSPRAARA